MQRLRLADCQLQNSIMKYLKMFISAGIAIMLINSCKKEAFTTKSSKSIDNSSLLVGKWELRQVIGGFGTKNFLSGNGLALEFTDSTYLTTDTTYKFFMLGNHHKKGYYEIFSDTSVNNSTGLQFPSQQFANRIILDKDSTSNKVFYQVTDNKLTIVSGYFPTDGGVEMTFQKQ